MLPHVVRPQRQQISPVECDFSADLRALVIQQPQQRERDGALAGSAFTHQAQDFTFRDLELDILQDARLVRIVHREARCEQRFHRWLTSFPPMASFSMFQNIWGRSDGGRDILYVCRNRRQRIRIHQKQHRRLVRNNLLHLVEGLLSVVGRPGPRSAPASVCRSPPPTASRESS